MPPAPQGAGSHVPTPQWADEPSSDQSLALRRYLAALRRYRWVVLLVTLLGTGAGVAATRFLPNEYVAQATIWIETTSGREAERGPIRSSELLHASAWLDLLRSYLVLDHVVRERRLYLRPGTPADSAALSTFRLQDRFAPGDYRLLVDETARTFRLTSSEDGRILERGEIGDSVGADLGFAWAFPSTAVRPGQRIGFTVINPRDAAIRLGEQLKTRLDPNGTFLRIELAGEDPRGVAQVLNAVADRYIEVAADLKGAKLRELTSILDEQLGYAERQLRESEAALEEFRVRTITLPAEPATPVTPGLEITRDPVFTNFFDMKVKIEQLRSDREALERALEPPADSTQMVVALEAIPAVQGSMELRQALDDLTAKRAELRTLRTRYTDQHRVVQQRVDELATLEGRVIPALVASLIAELSARETELNRLVGSASGELRQIPPRAIEEARLSRRVQIAANLYTTLQQRYEEARLAAASSIPDVRILDRAVVPHVPVNSKRVPRLILLAFMGSLGLGVCGAVLLDRVDRRVRYPEQVTHEMGLPILGAVPHLRSRNGHPGNRRDRQHVIEAFRGIRLGLTHAYGAAGPLVVTVTSPGSGDGKSFVASNLALSFADLGHRPLLIDADCRRGALHGLLTAGDKPGLTDYLVGQAAREQIVQRTAYPSLRLIACGTRMHRAPELLGSAAMLELLAELRSLYSVIIVDTPPLGAGSDALTMGILTGNVVLVLRTGTTDRELTHMKLELLDRLPVRLLGAILNDVPPRGVYRYYAYLPGYETREERPATL